MRYVFLVFFMVSYGVYAAEINAPHVVVINVNVPGDTLTNVIDPSSAATLSAPEWLMGKQVRKWRIISLGMGVLYIGACYCVQQTQWLMSDSAAWLNWNASLALEQLLAQPQKELYVALKKEIEVRCQSPAIPIIVTVTQFLKETDAELTSLRRYVRVCGWLERIPWGLTICFADQASIRRAYDSIKRLVYLRSIIAQELEPQSVLRRIDLLNFNAF